MTRKEPPLAELLYTLPPRPEDVTPEDVLDRFLRYVKQRGLTLYPAQEEAILEIATGKNVILSTPTGSGKSLVAAAMHFLATAERRRSFYTCPIKALVSEKFFDLCREFGPDYVGMMTGDATVNRDAPIVCCTAEILANMALREGSRADVDYVVMDEFHYYADKDRGTAWQVPLLTLPQARFLLMSATMGDATFFEQKLTELTGVETATIRASTRPVPLDFDYRETPLHETILDLVRAGRAPIYVVCFTQRGAAEEAQNLMSADYSTKEEKKAIAAALEGVRWSSPYGKDVQRFVRHGVGIHHAGLLPKYRLLVEKLAQKGQLKVICGTDTLGVGVNVPIKTVLFTKLCKFDGEKTAILTARDFHQISGRAGRKGFDDQGFVVAQAPEHVIENQRMEQRAGGDKAKLRKMVKKKPPEKGYVHWDKATFERLTTASPEQLVSRLQVTHGMVLNVLSREGGGCLELGRILKRSHERPAAQKKLGRHALALTKSLFDAGIIDRKDGRTHVNVDLQEDFSLNHALGLYLLDTVFLLEPESETYALDLLTLVESILENPDAILMRQLDRLKQLKLFELKAAGVEYEERIAELDKMEYPKPNREFVYSTFNAFALKHPWVGTENIRPKSIAREMFETFQSFNEYVKEYGLERSEGLLLRYLSDVYKTLVQSVPAPKKTPETDDIETYFGAIVRSVDASLLDEWERMRDGVPADRREETGALPIDTNDVTTDTRGFTVLVRNAVFGLVRALARRDYEAAVTLLDVPGEWTARRLDEAMAPYFAEHARVRVDPPARVPAHTRIDAEDGHVWRVEQVLLDDEGPSGWALGLTVDLARSREAGRAVLALDRIGL